MADKPPPQPPERSPSSQTHPFPISPFLTQPPGQPNCHLSQPSPDINTYNLHPLLHQQSPPPNPSNQFPQSPFNSGHPYPLYPYYPEPLPPAPMAPAAPPHPSTLPSSAPSNQEINLSKPAKGKCQTRTSKKKQAKLNSPDDPVNIEDGEQVTSTRKQSVSWLKDLNSDGKSSMHLLVDWMSDLNNYSQWRSANVSKRHVAERIRDYFGQNNITNRTVEGIIDQIGRLETSWRKAHDYHKETGAGVMHDLELLKEENGWDENNDEYVKAKEAANAQITKRCRWYWELEPVMGDRPSAAPLEMASTKEALVVLDDFHSTLGFRFSGGSLDQVDRDGDDSDFNADDHSKHSLQIRRNRFMTLNSPPGTPELGEGVDLTESTPLSGPSEINSSLMVSHSRNSLTSQSSDQHSIKRQSSFGQPSLQSNRTVSKKTRKSGAEDLMKTFMSSHLPDPEEQKESLRLERRMVEGQLSSGERIAEAAALISQAISTNSSHSKNIENDEGASLELEKKCLDIQLARQNMELDIEAKILKRKQDEEKHKAEMIKVELDVLEKRSKCFGSLLKDGINYEDASKIINDTFGPLPSKGNSGD